MGLLLIVMMSAPVFMLLGKSGKIIESFQMNFNQENEKREEREVENLQMIYLRKGYAAELQKKIMESLKNCGIEVQDVEVREGEYSIQTEEYDSRAVDHSASAGVTVGSGSPACG